MELIYKAIINAALFLVICILGVILHKNGNPYNNLLLTIHKLISVAFIVFVSFIIINYLKNNEISGLFLISIIITALASVILLASGGLISAEKFQEPMKIVHRVFTLVLLFGGSALFYLLLNNSLSSETF